MLGQSWRKSDYLRLKEVSVSYTFDGKMLKNFLGLSALKLYVTANNLLTFSDLPEGDPESRYLVWGDYPHMRTVKLGLQLGF